MIHPRIILLYYYYYDISPHYIRGMFVTFWVVVRLTFLYPSFPPSWPSCYVFVDRLCPDSSICVASADGCWQQVCTSTGFMAAGKRYAMLRGSLLWCLHEMSFPLRSGEGRTFLFSDCGTAASEGVGKYSFRPKIRRTTDTLGNRLFSSRKSTFFEMRQWVGEFWIFPNLNVDSTLRSAPLCWALFLARVVPSTLVCGAASVEAMDGAAASSGERVAYTWDVPVQLMLHDYTIITYYYRNTWRTHELCRVD